MSQYTRGRYATVKFGTSTGGLQTIELLGSWELAISFDEVDASVFGTTWRRSLTGMSGWTATVNGFINAATSEGQLGGTTGWTGVFPNALSGAVVQDIRLYLQTSSGLFWMPNYSTSATVTSTDAGCYLSNIRNSIDKAGLGTLSFSALGYDAIALYQGTTATIVAQSTG